VQLWLDFFHVNFLAKFDKPENRNSGTAPKYLLRGAFSFCALPPMIIAPGRYEKGKD
jgi:hypothetical protein